LAIFYLAKVCPAEKVSCVIVLERAGKGLLGLILGLVVCAARPIFAQGHSPSEAAAKMTVPFGPVIPVAAILIALAILFGAKPEQLRAGGYALAAGAVLFLIAVGSRKRS